MNDSIAERIKQSRLEVGCVDPDCDLREVMILTQEEVDAELKEYAKEKSSAPSQPLRQHQS